MTTPAVRVEGLVVQAGGRTLLQVPQLELAAGERVAIVGPNGAGKSTLLRVLGGFVPAAAGRVQVLGRTLGPALGAAALRALRAEVGQVHQGLHLVPRLTARENVLVGALARVPGWRSWARLYPAPLCAEADAALAAFGLAARAHERADRLSGGERQKLGLARLQLQRPRLVLADEPTAALDPSAAAEACDTLCRVAAGSTLVTVVHQPALLPRLAERVLGLAGGRIVFDLPVGSVGPEVLDRLYGPAMPDPVPPDPPEEHRMSVTRTLAAAVGAITLAGCAAPGPQDHGIVALKSPHGASETMNRFEAQAKQRGLAVAARVDHAAGAARIGRTLRPTELLIFGNPQAGTPLMECAQGVGIDLPMKALVWADAQGQVWLGYNDPAWIVRRHGAPDCAAAANVAKALAGIAAAAVAP